MIDTARGRTIVAIAGFLLLVLLASYIQFLRDRVLQTTGTLALQSLNASVIKNERLTKLTQADVQVNLVFLNLNEQLVQYKIEGYSLNLGGVEVNPGLIVGGARVFTNNLVGKSGYVYPKTQLVFYSPRSTTPLRQPIIGMLYYKISYHVVGSHIIHRTTKSVTFECWWSSADDKLGRVEFVASEEREE